MLIIARPTLWRWERLVLRIAARLGVLLGEFMCLVLFHPCPCKGPDEHVLVASETMTLFMWARNAGGTHASGPAFLQVEPAVSCD